MLIYDQDLSRPVGCGRDNEGCKGFMPQSGKKVGLGRGELQVQLELTLSCKYQGATDGS